MTISERIKQLINTRDWQGMQRMLGSLSNMEFRRMESTMRISVLPELDNDLLWETLLHLIIYNKAAFITGVTAIEHLVKNDTLDFNNEALSKLVSHLKSRNPESIIKMANIMIPFLKNEKQINEMFEALLIHNENDKLKILLKIDTPLSYFIIFKILRIADNKALAYKCSQVIIKRNNDMAFNVASLIKTYWAIDNLPIRFSLTIEEYELSHIDRSYENFLNILNGKRPQI